MRPHSLERAARARAIGDLRREAARHRPPRLALDGFGVIAEVKLRAPSAGALHTPADPHGFVAARARTYAGAGAVGVSVLTEPDRFGGDLGHLEAAAASCPVPVMRKDFLVDPVQVWEAAAAGASGVLLIVRMLDDAELEALLAATVEAGLFALVEAFDQRDLQRLAGHALGPDTLVGVNTRDLVTLEVVPERLRDLRPLVPPEVPAVAESGMTGAADVGRAAAQGWDLALVGTALMRTSDPAALLRKMTATGREMSCPS